MTPEQAAADIVAQHLPDLPEVRAYALREAIRWAMVQQRIEARRPPELPAQHLPAVVEEIVWFIDDYEIRVGADYVSHIRALRECKARVLALALGQQVPARKKAGAA